ncbi:MAG: trehalose-phosphatase [Candidatus Aureabacteria bacterium]|nr:trehalose-phosphatase [Candidatus Auribacterota bacterium]
MGKFSFDSVIFDMDGVVTQTARIHVDAWKIVFDEYLRSRESKFSEEFREFSPEVDYLKFVDGKPRYKGVQSFFRSRKISIPFGDPDDNPDKETCCGIGNKKNLIFNELLDKEGAEVFVPAIDLIKSLKSAGIRVGIVSSSKNCQKIIRAAGIEDLFETRVDGVISAELGLKGKPEGDAFVTAALNLKKSPARSVVVEDARSGVQAGRNGGFGLIIGVARKNNEKSLLKYGADVVVRDLSPVTIERIEEWFQKIPDPLFERWKKPVPKMKDLNDLKGIIKNFHYYRSPKNLLFSRQKTIFFLDYDGTLTPIVDRPDMAIMSDEMRDVTKRLSEKHQTAIVSGRMREDVENLVKIDGLFYAGSHGFDIKGPGFSMIQPEVQAIIPTIQNITKQLKARFGTMEGAIVEHKKFSVAMHYRLVDEKNVPVISTFVNSLVSDNPDLRLMNGKKVFEILPAIYWHKGKAIRWIIKTLDISWKNTRVVYIGDDTTDEDAFRAIRHNGLGILVSDKPKPSAAHFQISNPDEVKKLFELILSS